MDGGKKYLDPNESKMDLNKHSNRSKASTYTPANFNPFIKENCNDSSFYTNDHKSYKVSKRDDIKKNSFMSINSQNLSRVPKYGFFSTNEDFNNL